MRYLLIFMIWAIASTLRFIWEFKIVSYKDFITACKDNDHLDLEF